jgi:hypothetical protein
MSKMLANLDNVAPNALQQLVCFAQHALDQALEASAFSAGA